MLLCHKCAGLLGHRTGEDITGLLNCRCMSGYVRGFEDDVTRAEAIVEQYDMQESWKDLFITQGRHKSELDVLEKKQEQLLALL